MSNGGCPRFKQNAWKKEMCSNCYKAKEEHQERPKPVLPDLPLISPSPSILKGWDRERKKKRKSVSFPLEESEVIGYGGEVSSDDDEDYDMCANGHGGEDEDEEDVDMEDGGGGGWGTPAAQDTEEDKRLTSITKSNTDFNSLLGNLTSAVNNNPAAAPVHKQQQSPPVRETIQVTIQPFSNNLATSRKLHLNKLLQDNGPSLTIIPCEKKEEPPSLQKESEVAKKVTVKEAVETQKVIVKEPEPLKVTVKDKEPEVRKITVRESDLRKINIVKETEDRKNPAKETGNNKITPKDAESRKVNITRGTVLTKNHESVKNKLYIQNIMNGTKDVKRNQENNKVYITTPKADTEIEYLNGKNVLTSELLSQKKEMPMESREMAGEPDGKADSDGAEVPVTPPPRVSFLHRDLEQSKGIKRQAPKPPSESESEPDHDSTKLENESAVSPTESVFDHPPPPVLSAMLSEILKITEENGGSNKSHTELSTLQPDIIRVSYTSILNNPRPESRLSFDQGDTCDHEVSPNRVNNNSATLDVTRRYSCDHDFPRRSPSDASRRLSCDQHPAAEQPKRPDSLRISVSSTEGSSPEPPTHDTVTTTNRLLLSSVKRDPPPLPTTMPPSPGKTSPPEPLPRHHKAFMDVEKKKTKMKETIKKLLRFGSKEEMESEVLQPRPRPQIIHPLDLNKSAVQVLPSSNITKSPSPETPPSPQTLATNPIGRPNKPPPPPRSESLNLIERLRGKPGAENNIYANIGEARSGITPVKPMRTGSMREVTKLTVREQDNLYEAISASSAPECDRTSLPYCGSETESDTYSHTLFSRERCRMRRGRVISVYPTVSENFAAIAEINQQTLSYLLKQTLERGKEKSGRWSDYAVSKEGKKEIGEAVFLEGERGGRLVTLCVSPRECRLVTAPALSPLTTFVDTLPPDDLTQHTDCEISVLNRVEVENLKDYKEDEGALVLLQMCQIMESLQLQHYTLESFVILTDKHNYPTIGYLHNKSNGSLGETWKSIVMSAAELTRLEMSDQLGCTASLEEAICLLHAWLWGPPASMESTSLRWWLQLQRAALLRSLVTDASSVDHLRLAFLAASPDLTTIHNYSALLELVN